MVSIERVQVEEGFLDGLDLHFTPGLNVIIGPRGAGKTSVVELIRYCLAVRGFTRESDEEARQHALSVLESGRVTVTLGTGNGKYSVTRTEEEGSLQSSGPSTFDPPTILSQREIERLGLDAQGRLRLIDAFREGRGVALSEEQSLQASIQSLTAEMKSVSREIQATSNQIDELRFVPDEMETAAAEEASLLASLEANQSDRDELERLGQSMAALNVRLSAYDRSLDTLTAWSHRIELLIASPARLEDWPEAARSADPLKSVRSAVTEATRRLQEAVKLLNQATAMVVDLTTVDKNQLLEQQERARALRKRLEEIQEGAGAVTRRLAQLRERASQVAALEQLVATRNQQLGELQGRRVKLLDQLDALREERFTDRSQIVESLNSQLGPSIRIELERYGHHPQYTSAIAAALRGSGLHYNTLAPLLARQLSPRELVEAVENRDVIGLAELARLSADRASRMVDHLSGQPLEEILTAPLEDLVQLRLLDGRTYKSTEEASTGQRCTVILPILLARKGQTLIVDQPEDHLDNAFIVDTLIKALLRIGQDGQIIFTTHNPNIPVLGDAAHVVQLDSDGKRGFSVHAGPLDSPRTVKAITSVMEGGAEAFEKRARFYRLGVSPIYESS